jgi:hypothetical protein
VQVLSSFQLLDAALEYVRALKRREIQLRAIHAVRFINSPAAINHLWQGVNLDGREGEMNSKLIHANADVSTHRERRECSLGLDNKLRTCLMMSIYHRAHIGFGIHSSGKIVKLIWRENSFIHETKNHLKKIYEDKESISVLKNAQKFVALIFHFPITYSHKILKNY